MANLLADPSLWSDQNDASPPAAWNGLAYSWDNSYAFPVPILTLKAGAAEGDTIECEWVITPDPHSSNDPNWYVNGGRLFPDNHVSIQLHAGDIVTIEPQMQNCGYDETLTITPPLPPPPIAPSIRQMTTHRINRGIDSPVTCYARTESGRPDLSAAVLSVVIRPYGGQRVLATLEATGNASGKIEFTVPAWIFASVGLGYDYGLSCDPRNLARFDVLNDGALAYQALMEVV